MDRFVAQLPDSVEELCLIRLGILVKSFRAWPFVARIGGAMQRSTAEAIASGAGLLGSENFRIARGHFGLLQYWSSFEAMEAWSHRPPHSDWWREALERMRLKEDFGIYHETYLVPRAGVESIYLNSPRVGLASFGVTGEAVGRATTSRDRLGRRAGAGAEGG